MGKTKQHRQAVPKRSCKLNFVAKVAQTGQKWPQLAQTGQDNLGENNWSQNVVCQYWPQPLLNQLVWDTLYIHIILSSKRHFSTQVAETIGALALTLPLTVWALKNSGNTCSGEKHLQASSEQNVVAKVPSGWRQAGLVICPFLYSNFWLNGQIEKFKAVVSNQGSCSKCFSHYKYVIPTTWL